MGNGPGNVADPTDNNQRSDNAKGQRGKNPGKQGIAKEINIRIKEGDQKLTHGYAPSRYSSDRDGSSADPPINFSNQISGERAGRMNLYCFIDTGYTLKKGRSKTHLMRHHDNGHALVQLA